MMKKISKELVYKIVSGGVILLANIFSIIDGRKK